MADTPPPYETDNFVADQDKEQFIPSEQPKQQQQQAPPQPLYAPQQQQQQGYAQAPPQPVYATQQQQHGYAPAPRQLYPQSIQQHSSNVTVVTAQPAAGVMVRTLDTKPESYLGLSIFSFLCCCWLFGLIALVYSCQVDSAWTVGDVNGAVSASRNAKSWNFASIITGIVVLVLNGVAIGIYYASSASRIK